jgi:hypothetical protein
MRQLSDHESLRRRYFFIKPLGNGRAVFGMFQSFRRASNDIAANRHLQMNLMRWEKIAGLLM